MAKKLPTSSTCKNMLCRIWKYYLYMAKLLTTLYYWCLKFTNSSAILHTQGEHQIACNINKQNPCFTIQWYISETEVVVHTLYNYLVIFLYPFCNAKIAGTINKERWSTSGSVKQRWHCSLRPAKSPCDVMMPSPT